MALRKIYLPQAILRFPVVGHTLGSPIDSIHCTKAVE